MKYSYRAVPAVFLMLLGTVFLVSGCSALWVLPGQGGAALFFAVLLTLAANLSALGLRGRAAAADPAVEPHASPAGVRAPLASDQMAVGAVLQGDGFAEYAGAEQAGAIGAAWDEPTIIAGDGFSASLFDPHFAERGGLEPETGHWGAGESAGDGLGTSYWAAPGLGDRAGGGISDYTVFDGAAHATGHAVAPSQGQASPWADGLGAGGTAFGPGTVFGDGLGAEIEGQALLVRGGEKINPMEGDKRAIGNGGVRFNTRCGTYCHAARAIGGSCPSLVDASWIHGEEDISIYKVIVGGAPGTRMGAFGGEFSADEIWEIIAYLRFRGREYRLDLAGEGSLTAQTIDCPDEVMVHITTVRNKEFSGILVIEDQKSFMIEDRSGKNVIRLRVKKNRIDKASAECIEE